LCQVAGRAVNGLGGKLLFGYEVCHSYSFSHYYSGWRCCPKVIVDAIVLAGWLFLWRAAGVRLLGRLFGRLFGEEELVISDYFVSIRCRLWEKAGRSCSKQPISSGGIQTVIYLEAPTDILDYGGQLVWHSIMEQTPFDLALGLRRRKRGVFFGRLSFLQSELSRQV
jgi:hypothetical protein